MKLLDLFCGAGGAAVGYHRAGFDEIVGVDNKPQPRYPFTFVLGDALEYVAAHGHEFDAIHASPPCQAFTVLRSVTGDREYPDLVAATRAVLTATGRHFVIENVPRAPLRAVITLCGLALGLQVKRHRDFEASVILLAPGCPSHVGDWYHVSGNGSARRHRANSKTPRREAHGAQHARQVMGAEWMTFKELAQAVPPAYTQFIGRQLLQALAVVPA